MKYLTLTLCFSRDLPLLHHWNFTSEINKGYFNPINRSEEFQPDICVSFPNLSLKKTEFYEKSEKKVQYNIKTPFYFCCWRMKVNHNMLYLFNASRKKLRQQKFYSRFKLLLARPIARQRRVDEPPFGLLVLKVSILSTYTNIRHLSQGWEYFIHKCLDKSELLLIERSLCP